MRIKNFSQTISFALNSRSGKAFNLSVKDGIYFHKDDIQHLYKLLAHNKKDDEYRHLPIFS